MQACASNKKEKVEHLLSRGVDVNFRGPEGKTPLISAAERGSTEVVHFLLSKGADVNRGDLRDVTPLTFAAKHGHLKVVEILLANGARVYTKTGFLGKSALEGAFDAGHDDIRKLLIERGAGEGELTGLFSDFTIPLADPTGDLRFFSVRRLLEMGVNPDAFEWTGATCLIMACNQGLVRLVKLLLSFGANPNLGHQTSGSTPLMWALGYNGSGGTQRIKEMVTELVRHGANGHLRMSDGRTPIDVARQKGYQEVAAILAGETSGPR